MGLRFDPIGGGQFKQAVQQIIEAEGQPIKALEVRKNKENARFKLFQEFKSKFSPLDKSISELSNFRKFREMKVDLGDGSNLVGITLDKERAEPGQYTLEVLDLATRSATLSIGVSDPNEPALGMGFITINQTDGNSHEIYVDDQQSSLYGIAKLINQHTNSPVRAAVIKDASSTDEPWKLLLTGKKDGALNQLDIPEFYFMDTDVSFYIDDDKDAKNAEFTIDGFAIEGASNDINEFLPGVNLHLKQAHPDHPFTITISADNQKMTGKIKSLIDNLNQILQFIGKQNAIDQHTDTTTTFAGDTSLQTMEYRLRNLIHQSFPAGDPDSDDFTLITMNQLGVEFDKAGTLLFKEEKFNKSLEDNFDHISDAITGPTGFIQQIRATIDGYTQSSNGLLAVKERGIQSRIKEIDNQIDQKTRLLDKRKEDLVSQYSRLESTLGNLQRQQQFLSASLPGAGSGGNIVSQLLGG